MQYKGDVTGDTEMKAAAAAVANGQKKNQNKNYNLESLEPTHKDKGIHKTNTLCTHLKISHMPLNKLCFLKDVTNQSKKFYSYLCLGK